MANSNVRIKRSSISGKRPTISQLELGELALNTNDGRLFTRKYNVGIGSTVTLLNVWTENIGGSAYYNGGNVGIGTDNPGSTLAVGGTITELYNGTYWNVVTQADVGYGASQVPLNQYLGQLAFLDDYHPNGLRRDGGGSDDVVVGAGGSVGIGLTNPTAKLDVYDNTSGSGSTDGTTLLNLRNYAGNDLSQQKTFIDFIFTDNNNNETPQVRIGAEVGENGDANNETLEGSGAFVVYTNDSDSVSGAAGASLAERFRVDYAGNVGINSTAPTEKLDVVGTVKATDFNTTSDQNLKTNIRTIENPLDKIAQIRGVNFEWKETSKPSVGVIAQEVEKVFPELVNGESTKTVNYNGIIGLLIEAVKVQQEEIDMLKEKLK